MRFSKFRTVGPKGQFLHSTQFSGGSSCLCCFRVAFAQQDIPHTSSFWSRLYIEDRRCWVRVMARQGRSWVGGTGPQENNLSQTQQKGEQTVNKEGRITVQACCRKGRREKQLRISFVLQLAFAKASFWHVAQIPRGHTRPCI